MTDTEWFSHSELRCYWQKSRHVSAYTGPQIHHQTGLQTDTGMLEKAKGPLISRMTQKRHSAKNSYITDFITVDFCIPQTSGTSHFDLTANPPVSCISYLGLCQISISGPCNLNINLFFWPSVHKTCPHDALLYVSLTGPGYVPQFFLGI